MGLKLQKWTRCIAVDFWGSNGHVVPLDFWARASLSLCSGCLANMEFFPTTTARSGHLGLGLDTDADTDTDTDILKWMAGLPQANLFGAVVGCRLRGWRPKTVTVVRWVKEQNGQASTSISSNSPKTTKAPNTKWSICSNSSQCTESRVKHTKHRKLLVWNTEWWRMEWTKGKAQNEQNQQWQHFRKSEWPSFQDAQRAQNAQGSRFKVESSEWTECRWLGVHYCRVN